jgi:beta-lactamase superfamily II metal-dependent hydrolase
MWTGLEMRLIDPAKSRSAPYARLIDALAHSKNPAIIKENLLAENRNIVPGTTLNVGAVKFIFLFGFGKPLEDWDELDPAEKMNGVSIVMKMEYDNKSVLFSGDAVGRHREDPVGITNDTDPIKIDEMKFNQQNQKKMGFFLLCIRGATTIRI